MVNFMIMNNKKKKIYIQTDHTWLVAPHSACESYLIQTRYLATVYDIETNISLLERGGKSNVGKLQFHS